MFGLSSLEELPDLPRYKIDENEQIVIDDLVEPEEAPMPAREEQEDVKTESIEEGEIKNG